MACCWSVDLCSYNGHQAGHVSTMSKHGSRPSTFTACPIVARMHRDRLGCLLVHDQIAPMWVHAANAAPHCCK